MHETWISGTQGEGVTREGREALGVGGITQDARRGSTQKRDQKKKKIEEMVFERKKKEGREDVHLIRVAEALLRRRKRAQRHCLP